MNCADVVAYRNTLLSSLPQSSGGHCTEASPGVGGGDNIREGAPSSSCPQQANNQDNSNGNIDGDRDRDRDGDAASSSSEFAVMLVNARPLSLSVGADVGYRVGGGLWGPIVEVTDVFVLFDGILDMDSGNESMLVDEIWRCIHHHDEEESKGEEGDGEGYQEVGGKGYRAAVTAAVYKPPSRDIYRYHSVCLADLI
jgi:hypothetical protein